jgi:hypothetical protein
MLVEVIGVLHYLLKHPPLMADLPRCGGLGVIRVDSHSHRQYSLTVVVLRRRYYAHLNCSQKGATKFECTGAAHHRQGYVGALITEEGGTTCIMQSVSDYRMNDATSLVRVA